MYHTSPLPARMHDTFFMFSALLDVYKRQVMHSRKLSSDLHQLVKGVMIESYIEEGNQKVGAGCYGKSITDPCLGWDDTERLIYDIAEYE